MTDFICNSCVCCGRELPEGVMVCRVCEAKSCDSANRSYCALAVRPQHRQKKLWGRRKICTL